MTKLSTSFRLMFLRHMLKLTIDYLAKLIERLAVAAIDRVTDWLVEASRKSDRSQIEDVAVAVAEPVAQLVTEVLPARRR
jgi:hypothetical protein